MKVMTHGIRVYPLDLVSKCVGSGRTVVAAGKLVFTVDCHEHLKDSPSGNLRRYLAITLGLYIQPMFGICG